MRIVRACHRLALALLLMSGIAAASPTPAPRVSATTVDALPKPLPLPYDEAADGLASVQRGRALARARHKRLLIDLGGNWCLDCRILAATMALPELRTFLDSHFVIVKVDIGRFDKNGAVAAHYGIIRRLDGVPAILVVDPKHDTLINAGKYFALSDARSMTPQALADWLAQWT
ncbi:MAG TPA: thioredoxin family protein [Sphingomonas sp.]